MMDAVNNVIVQISDVVWNYLLLFLLKVLHHHVYLHLVWLIQLRQFQHFH